MVSLIPLVVFAHREMEANKLKAFLCRVGSTEEDRLKLKNLRFTSGASMLYVNFDIYVV